MLVIKKKQYSNK